MDYLVEGLSVRGALSYDHYFTKTLRVTPNLPVYSITRNPADPAELLYYGGEHNAKSYEETGWGKIARSMSRPASTSAAISASTPSRPWRSSLANATPRQG